MRKGKQLFNPHPIPPKAQWTETDVHISVNHFVYENIERHIEKAIWRRSWIFELCQQQTFYGVKKLSGFIEVSLMFLRKQNESYSISQHGEQDELRVLVQGDDRMIFLQLSSKQP